MPCGPSSVARLCAIASSDALAILYGPIVRCENRTTIELTMTTEPDVAASAGTNNRVIRSAETTLLLNPACTASRSTLQRSAMGGMTSALCTRASTLPNSSTAAVASRSASAATVMSVGTTRARRPSSLMSAATSSSRAAVRAASTTSAPAAAPRTAIWRPRSGPTPETTSTLSWRYISPAPCALAHHPDRNCGLPSGDARPVLGRRDPGLLIVRQPVREAGERNDLGLRAVSGGEIPGQPLPPDLDVAASTSGQLKPVGDARVLLADHEPQLAVHVGTALIGGEARLVIDVVERDVPHAAELNALVRGDVLARRGHRHDHRLVRAEVEVPDRRELRRQPARCPPRRRDGVHRLLQVEPLGERQECSQPRQQQLARDVVALGQQRRVRRWRCEPDLVRALDPQRAAALAFPVAVHLADDEHR